MTKKEFRADTLIIGLMVIWLLGCGVPKTGLDELMVDLGSNRLDGVVAWARATGLTERVGPFDRQKLPPGIRTEFLMSADLANEYEEARVLELTFMSGLEQRRLFIGSTNYVCSKPRSKRLQDGVYIQIQRN